jgi:hypothetical protein
VTTGGPPAEDGPARPAFAAKAAVDAAPGKYVPVHLRDGRAVADSSGSGGFRTEQRDELPTIRVTNLSSETDEDVLYNLFGVFGNIHRVFVGKDKDTGAHKGYGRQWLCAFVCFACFVVAPSIGFIYTCIFIVLLGFFFSSFFSFVCLYPQLCLHCLLRQAGGRDGREEDEWPRPRQSHLARRLGREAQTRRGRGWGRGPVRRWMCE